MPKNKIEYLLEIRLGKIEAYFYEYLKGRSYVKLQNRNAKHNLIFAGLGLRLGIISKDKIIRKFTE